MSRPTPREYGRRRTFLSRLVHRSAEDERGSMIVVLLLIAVLSTITVTVVNGTLSQLSLGADTTARNDALEGSLAGVQAAIADIRASGNNTAGSGSSGDSTDLIVQTSKMPCSITGQTNTANSATYNATIEYGYELSNGTRGNWATCTNGTGPSLTDSSGDYLVAAWITACSPAAQFASGNCNTTPTGSNWRRVVSTYLFQADNTSIPGGQIFSYDGKECFIANFSSSPAELDVTTSCASGTPREQFEFTSQSELKIQHAGSVWCVQNPEETGSPSSQPLQLVKNCPASPPYQWGINDTDQIQGVLTEASEDANDSSGDESPESAPAVGDPDSYCINNPLASDSPGQAAATMSSSNCPAGYSNTWTWQMKPSVGAGAAQPAGSGLFGPSNQLVNLQEFGNCLDVTNQSTSSSFLIDYNCKQFPDTANYPVWNQRWCFQPNSGQSTFPETGIIYTPYGQNSCAGASSPYCLQSPLSPAGSGGPYVIVTGGSGSACQLSQSSYPANLQWTAYSTAGGPLYDYTFTDSSGYCLEANINNKQAPSGNSDYFSTIQVATCNGSYMQKWNSPASLSQAQTANSHESTGGGSVSSP